MNLTEIMNGATVLIHANIFIYSVERRSLQCRHLLERCDGGSVHAFSSILALGEVCHCRMRNEAQEAGLIAGGNPARSLSEKRASVLQLSIYADNVSDLLDSTITIEPIQPHDFYTALELQRQHGLLTNDSLNLALAKRLGIQGIATADNGFDNVPGLIVYKPGDILI